MIEIREDDIPSDEDIKAGTASWKGMKIKYDPTLGPDGQNHTTYMRLGNKYMAHSPGTKRHILDHEVAHNLASEFMFERDKDEFFWPAREDGVFVKKYKAPPDYHMDYYWMGLYGDMNAHALEETLVEAILEYESNPEALKKRSIKGYELIDKFMKSRKGVDND